MPRSYPLWCPGAERAGGGAPVADREADPIAEQLTRRSRAARHDARARHYALRAVRPSPAREAAPEPAAWLSIADLGEVLDLEVELWADEMDLAAASPAPVSASVPATGATGNVTLVPAPLREALPDARPERGETADSVDLAFAPAPVVAFVPPQPGTRVEPVAVPAPARSKPRTRPGAPARPSLGQALVLTATAAAVAVGAMFASGPKQHEVTIELDGRSATRATDAGTVGDFLREQHVALGPLDRVIPGLGTHLGDGTVVHIERDAAAHAGKAIGVSAPPGAAPVPVAPSPPPASVPPPPSVSPASVPAPTAATPSTAASRSSLLGSKTPDPRTTPAASRAVNGSADGGASWYASPYGPDSCASRTLRFGTIVTITNIRTGATTTCRVADRGPVAPSRVLDLDNDVFRRLAPLGIGVIPVHITW